jgi:hypothetical protein
VSTRLQRAVVAAIEEYQRPDPVLGGGWEWGPWGVGWIGYRNPDGRWLVEGPNAFLECLRRRCGGKVHGRET